MGIGVDGGVVENKDWLRIMAGLEALLRSENRSGGGRVRASPLPDITISD